MRSVSMNPAQSQKQFHSHADSRRFRNRICNPFLCSKERRLADLIAQAVPPGALRLLEVGCGEGSNLMYLQERLGGLEFVGLDFSFEKTRFLDLHCAPSKAVCGDATQLPFGAGQFDVVLYRDLLHHVNWARDRVLSEGLRVVSQEGVLIVVESNGRTFLNRVLQWLCPAERGLKDSTRPRLLALGNSLGKPTIEHVEASFLVRGLGFVVGWPDHVARWLIWPAYALAYACERVVEWVAPRHSWSYMMMFIRRD